MTTLAEYLRGRREQLHPSDVGLADHGRRRTPGLRREEVATLAGVSIDYLVRLEQGRDTHPSPGVVRALADALRLDDDERRQLYTLATIGSNPELCTRSDAPSRDVAPTVTVLLRSLDPTPGFVVGALNDVLAWNAAWERLVTPLGLLDDAAPNTARHVFLHPRARDVYSDWIAVADEQVNHLRLAGGKWADDEAYAQLIDDLHEVPEFVDRWSVFGAAERRRGVLRVAHPDLGAVRLAYEVLFLPDDDQRLVTWLPVDDRTSTALASAVDAPVSPARLRVIG